MKNFLEKFIKTTLVIALALAFLGYMLVRGALSNFTNYVSYFMFFLGISLIVLFGIVLLIAVIHSKKKALAAEVKKLSLKNYGTKFIIDLDEVRIKSNNWESSRFIEAHLQDIEINEKNVQTILEFDVEINGEKKQFHYPTDMQPKSLEMYFAIQKETNFYLHPEDPSQYYLDLRFITD